MAKRYAYSVKDPLEPPHTFNRIVTFVYRLMTIVGAVLLAIGMVHGLLRFNERPPSQPLVGTQEVLAPISCGSPWHPSSNLPYMPVKGGRIVTPCAERLHTRRSRADGLIGAGALVVLGSAGWDTKRRRAAIHRSIDQEVRL